MRGRRALLVIAGACGGKHPAAPVVISNVAPPDAAEADADGIECEAPEAAPMRIGGVDGEVSLVRCDTGDSSPSDTAREQGFIEHNKIARLTWKAGKKTVTSEIRSWTNGWEWGSGIGLDGVLLAPNGEGIALLTWRSSAAAPDLSGSSATLMAYTLQNDDWTFSDVVSANTLDLTWATDHHTVTIDGCELDNGSAAPGCGDIAAAKPIPTLDATYDGKTVTTTPQPQQQP